MTRLPSFALLALALLTTTFTHAGDEGPYADKSSYLSNLAKELEVRWPKNRTITIVCHGHSVPAGYFTKQVVNTFNAYPHLLHKALKDRFPLAVINVIVTAIGGEHAVRGAERFESDVLALNPDLITIDYALNDRSIGLEAAKTAWEEMIAKAKERGIKVILLTPTADTRSKLDDPSDPLNQHAEQIKSLAKTHQLGLVDSLSAFVEYKNANGSLDEVMAQANHPNRKGHEFVAELLLEWFPQPE